MAKYGLQRGIRGSEARHTTTAQYYRDLKRQTGELEANVQQLQTERQQTDQKLDEVKQGIKSEKLEAAKTEAKAALVAKVGSLLGGGKLKAEREGFHQRIAELENKNARLQKTSCISWTNRVKYIRNLNYICNNILRSYSKWVILT